MKSQSERPREGQPGQREPRRRFRLERLEERIAPKKGGKGTKNCGGNVY